MNVIWEIQVPHKEEDKKIRFFLLADERSSGYSIWKKIGEWWSYNYRSLGINLDDYVGFENCEEHVYGTQEDMVKEFRDKLVQLEKDEITLDSLRSTVNMLNDMDRVYYSGFANTVHGTPRIHPDWATQSYVNIDNSGLDIPDITPDDQVAGT